ncbi:uncharacterized protein HMF8227_01353 [Saliniradius amylolyticus]|uniref:HDOD domain-containing protein n=1 Tax=Saliniradius amylolyticus TaxID=2183582 RepID=A0A2S2E2F9_9ALTE|nr:HDOD domain-containing protein [Saliniradius amylolyticus]AWL11831.1 uncharacterized protein HMF8227_01353 [Saliniradius amylolyticus]
MNVYCARQAILNRRLNTVAYQLTFRHSLDDDDSDNSYQALSRLVSQQHFGVGFRTLTQSRKAVLPITQEAINEGIGRFLSPKDVVLELDASVSLPQTVYEECQRLFHQGFRFALVNYIPGQGWDEFVNFTRLVRYDFNQFDTAKLATVTEPLKKRNNIKLLAYGINNKEQLDRAKSLAFEFFQGSSFHQPEAIASRDIESNHILIMAIYAEVLKKDMNIDRIADLFQRDVSLSYKLLRFINSGVYELVRPIESIRQAIIYLGNETARKFVSLIATAHIDNGKPKELLTVSIIRARFCELIAERHCPEQSTRAFLVGLFSMLDSFLDLPMEEIVEQLPVDDDVKGALLGEANALQHILALVQSYEEGSWYWTQRWSNVCEIHPDKLPQLHQTSLIWAQACDNLKEENDEL